MNDQRSLLAERAIRARMRSAKIRTQTDPPVPKGTRDRYHELVTPDGLFHGRVPKSQGRPTPEQVRMSLLAARKSMHRANAALAAYESDRLFLNYSVTTSNAYPIGGQQ